MLSYRLKDSKMMKKMKKSDHVSTATSITSSSSSDACPENLPAEGHVCNDSCFHRVVSKNVIPHSGAVNKLEKKIKKTKKARKIKVLKSTKAKAVVVNAKRGNIHLHGTPKDIAAGNKPVRVLKNPFSKSSHHRLITRTVFFDYPSSLLGEEKKMTRRKTAHLLEDSNRPKLRFKISSKVWEYNCVVNALHRSGFQRTPTTRLANVFWSNFLPAEQYCKLNPFQKVNHFPGSFGLGRKDLLIKNIMKLRRYHQTKFSSDFNFIPETFVLPGEWDLFKRRAQSLNGQMWIIKPTNKSCGKGIQVINKPSEVNKNKPCVVSKYVMDPHLIGGRKYDMRIYILVSCFNPLRVYMYRDGLVRFATKKYTTKATSTKQKYIHLTNYSVNKHSKNFVKNTDAGEDGIGSKWSVRALRSYLSERGIDDNKIWAEIEGVVIKTLLSIESDVNVRQKSYGINRNNCFEVMGFDILLDSSLKPWLLEVNNSPSLSSSSPLDKFIKTQLMTDALHLCGVPAVDAKKEISRLSKTRKARKLGDPIGHTNPSTLEIQKLRKMSDALDASQLSRYDLKVLTETHLEQERCGNFKRIFPTLKNCEKYNHLFQYHRYNNLLVYKWLNMNRAKAFGILHNCFALMISSSSSSARSQAGRHMNKRTPIQTNGGMFKSIANSNTSTRNVPPLTTTTTTKHRGRNGTPSRKIRHHSPTTHRSLTSRSQLRKSPEKVYYFSTKLVGEEESNKVLTSSRSVQQNDDDNKCFRSDDKDEAKCQSYQNLIEDIGVGEHEARMVSSRSETTKKSSVSPPLRTFFFKKNMTYAKSNSHRRVLSSTASLSHACSSKLELRSPRGRLSTTNLLRETSNFPSKFISPHRPVKSYASSTKKAQTKRQLRIGNLSSDPGQGGSTSRLFATYVDGDQDDAANKIVAMINRASSKTMLHICK